MRYFTRYFAALDAYDCGYATGETKWKLFYA